jgi:hypothetical protein
MSHIYHHADHSPGIHHAATLPLGYLARIPLMSDTAPPRNRIDNIPPHRRALGRPKGTPNKVPSDLRDIIMQAFDRLGGIDAMVKWGTKNPDSFYSNVLMRILPKEVHSRLDGNHSVSIGETIRDALSALDTVRRNRQPLTITTQSGRSIPMPEPLRTDAIPTFHDVANRASDVSDIARASRESAHLSAILPHPTIRYPIPARSNPQQNHIPDSEMEAPGSSQGPASGPAPIVPSAD